MSENEEIEPVPLREFHIDDLPDEPEKEFEFLKDEIGEPVFIRKDFWECESCGWHGDQKQLEQQVDYIRDDFKISRITYFVCPCCKYPGIDHVVQRANIHRNRKRPLVDPKGRFDTDD